MSGRVAVLLPCVALLSCASPQSPVELIPTSPDVLDTCAPELRQTYCDPIKATAAAKACEARLSSDEKAHCDASQGCVVTYEPTRSGTCHAGPTYGSLSQCTQPVADNCAFYRSCLDASHPCGADGYALGFGESLCYLFIEHRAEFTPQGQRWLQRVRTCLQEQLAPLVSGAVASCDDLADKAFTSHTTCYTELDNSFCDLPNEDVDALTNLVLPYLGLPRVMTQIEDVSRICAQRTRP